MERIDEAMARCLGHRLSGDRSKMEADSLVCPLRARDNIKSKIETEERTRQVRPRFLNRHEVDGWLVVAETGISGIECMWLNV